MRASPKSPISDSLGMSLLEVIVASGLIGVIMTLSASALSAIHRSQARVEAVIAQDRIVQSLVENIAADSSQFQINLRPADPGPMPPELNVATLPLAWSKTTLTEVAHCQLCPGRMGYVIQPLSGAAIQGMRLVSVRITHSAINNGKPRDFQFIVSEK